MIRIEAARQQVDPEAIAPGISRFDGEPLLTEVFRFVFGGNNAWAAHLLHVELLDEDRDRVLDWVETSGTAYPSGRLSFQAQLGTHTERYATEDLEGLWVRGTILRMRGQLDPCWFCAQHLKIQTAGGRRVEYFSQESGRWFIYEDGKETISDGSVRTTRGAVPLAPARTMIPRPNREFRGPGPATRGK